VKERQGKKNHNSLSDAETKIKKRTLADVKLNSKRERAKLLYRLRTDLKFSISQQEENADTE